MIGLKTRRKNAIASGLGIGEYLGESRNIGGDGEYSDTTTTGFSYDNLGNPKVYRGKELVWINGRQLSKYDGLTFNYDGQGRRIKKGTTEYTYGVNGELLKETDGNDTIEYIYDNGRVVSFIHNDTQYLYRRNIQGDIISIYGIDSLEKACYNYDSFGNVRVLNPDKTENLDTNFIGNINPIRYRGYYYDGETNFYFCLSRFYDPEIGRWINADDISYLDPESINGLNLFSYCGNNPIVNIDLDGHKWYEFWKWDWGKIAGWVAVGAIAVLSTVAVVAGTVATGGLGAVLVGAGIGAMSGISASIALQGGIQNIGNINPWKVALTGAIGGGVGALTGAFSYGISVMGSVLGQSFGYALSQSVIGGLKVAKVFSGILLMGTGKLVGGIAGGLIGTALGDYFVNTATGKSTTFGGIIGSESSSWITDFIRWLLS